MTVDNYLADIALTAKPKTVTTYRKALAVWARWSTGRQPTTATVAEWRQLLVANRKPSTARAYLQALKAYLLWAGVTLPTKLFAVKFNRDQVGRDALTADQARHLLATCGHLRDRAILALMLTTGLRDFQVAAANLEDVATKNGRRVLNVVAKGGEGRGNWVVIPPLLSTYLDAYLAYRGWHHGPLFANATHKHARLTPESVSRLVKGWLEVAGLKSPTVTAHSLRATFATLAVGEGVDVLTLRAAMAHSKLETTLHYVRYTQRLNAAPEDAVSSLLAKE